MVTSVQMADELDPLRVATAIGVALAVLAAGVSSIGCGASAPLRAPPSGAARPALPRLSWRPRDGAREVTCSPHEYDCDHAGLDTCESECARGDMPLCTALALHEGAPGKGGDHARSLALRRLACAKGFKPGCVALAADPAATAADRALIETTLAPACAEGDACGCSFHGSALVLYGPGEARGVELLSDACARGASDACDALAFAAELCERDPARGGYCVRIRADQPPP